MYTVKKIKTDTGPCGLWLLGTLCPYWVTIIWWCQRLQSKGTEREAERASQLTVAPASMQQRYRMENLKEDPSSGAPGSTGVVSQTPTVAATGILDTGATGPAVESSAAEPAAKNENVHVTASGNNLKLHLYVRQNVWSIDRNANFCSWAFERRCRWCWWKPRSCYHSADSRQKRRKFL